MRWGLLGFAISLPVVAGCLSTPEPPCSASSDFVDLPGYRDCAGDAGAGGICRFYYDEPGTLRPTCQEICEAEGRICVGGFDSDGVAPCINTVENGCHTRHGTQICECR